LDAFGGAGDVVAALGFLDDALKAFAGPASSVDEVVDGDGDALAG